MVSNFFYWYISFILVVPTTHLIMDDRIEDEADKDEVRVTKRTVTRTGFPVSFIRLGYFEPETTHASMNEFLHLLLIPALDSRFRGPDGNLRKKIAFIVDNGHGVDPDSHKNVLVQIDNVLPHPPNYTEVFCREGE